MRTTKTRCISRLVPVLERVVANSGIHMRTTSHTRVCVNYTQPTDGSSYRFSFGTVFDPAVLVLFCLRLTQLTHTELLRRLRSCVHYQGVTGGGVQLFSKAHCARLVLALCLASHACFCAHPCQLRQLVGVLADVFDGYNGCLLAYGQTGAGKTHTMTGPSIDDPEMRVILEATRPGVFFVCG